MKNTLKTIKLALLALGMAAFAATARAEYTDDCITFSSAKSFTLKTANASKNWDGTLWTSTDKTNWTEWNGAEVSAAQTSGTYNLYVRGNTANTKITVGYVWELTGSTGIACSGNIETLRGATGDQPSPTPMGIDCYWRMFNRCGALTDAPELPATTLATRCYQSMFFNCTALTNAPALPATTLAEWCYNSMFDGCTSLTAAPALPATTLAERCYFGMFYRCTSLTNAPALPATTLANSCYNSMFQDCTSLKAAPTLPATTLADWCYYCMFYGCKALTNAPELPAMMLAEYCYGCMFYDCTLLVSAPALPATTLANSCYYKMFYGCTELTNVPTLPALTLVNECYRSMFYGCTALEVNTEAPGKEWKIPATSTKASWWGTDMFTGTKGTLAGQPALNTTYYIKSAVTIDDCITFSSTEAFTLKTNNGAKSWDGTLWTSTNKVDWTEWNGTMVSAAKTSDAYNLYVRGNASNTKITGGEGCQWVLDGSNIACTGNIETLRGATGDAPSPTDMGSFCYYGMFRDCTLLVKAPELPATMLANSCYYEMFRGCTALTDSPALPATTLADNCYYGMFSGCTALEVNTAAPGKEWKVPATSTIATDWGTDMFSGTAGTLLNQPTLNMTYYIKSAIIDDCIAFSSAASFTLTAGKSWDGTLWTSTDKFNWTEWTGASVSAAQTGGTYYLYVRGDTRNTKITHGGSWKLDGSANIACTGNIETLRGATGNNPSPTPMGESCYASMFYGCRSLTNAPALSAQTLAGSCCSYMFAFCTALINAPALQATTLATQCYLRMFLGCTALRTAPTLPATELADHCYYNMFDGCTALTNVPALSATSLADSCCDGMFSSCTALTNAPALPATSLAMLCYSRMFYGCTALTNAPALPATTLADRCYYNMFYGCTALTDLPALPATTLADGCYELMFYNCTALEVNTADPGKEWKIPVTSTLATGWGSYMFTGTKGTLQGQPELNTTYYIASMMPGSEDFPWPIGAGKGDTVEAWTNGTTLVVQGEGKMMDFDAEDSVVPWPVEQIAAVNISSNVTAIGQNAWLGLADSVIYNGISSGAMKTMSNGFGGTTQYARTAFREFLVDGASINATVALETAKSLTNEWTEVELKASDVSVENGRIVIRHESAPQSQGFYLLQPTE